MATEVSTVGATLAWRSAPPHARPARTESPRMRIIRSTTILSLDGRAELEGRLAVYWEVVIVLKQLDREA